MIVLQILTRLLAFVGKELVETVRRPGAVLSLIVGPFLIMAVFGMGYQGHRAPLRTIVVVPTESGLPTDAQTYRDLAPGMDVTEVTQDRTKAEQALRDRQVDVAVIAPPDAMQRFRAGQQSVIEVRVNEVDPVQEGYDSVFAAQLSSEVNRRIIEQAATDGQQAALDAGQPGASQIPPKVIAQPTTTNLENLAPTRPDVVAFFGAAMLALILQHFAVTLVSLSLVRERTSGIIELFRIAPISTWEVIVGKVLAFGILAAVVGVVTTALLGAMGVPMLGDPGMLALVLGLLLLASLGLGILIAILSDSERQAVQLSLLVLLASVFLSGFVLSIDEFTAPVRTLAYALPVTHGIRLAQDVMLRGSTSEPWHVWALAGIALGLLTVSWVLLRRSMARI